MKKQIEIIDITKKNNKYILETKDEKITIDEQTLLKFNFNKNEKISNEQLEELKKQIVFQKLFDKTLRLLSFRSRSEKEIDDYLNKNKAEDEIKVLIFKKLKDYNYLNDKEFAKQLFRYEIDVKKRGPLFIEKKLLDKGINRGIIEEIIADYSDDLVEEKIIDIIDKESLRNKKFPIRKRKKIITSKLLRDGFPNSKVYDEISKLYIKDESQEYLSKELKKLKSRYCDLASYERKSKIVKSLLSKGYDYNDIISKLKED